jgi:hypothetical protein
MIQNEIPPRKRSRTTALKRKKIGDCSPLPRPWTVEDIGGCFVVKASNDRPLLFHGGLIASRAHLLSGSLKVSGKVRA